MGSKELEKALNEMEPSNLQKLLDQIDHDPWYIKLWCWWNLKKWQASCWSRKFWDKSFDGYLFKKEPVKPIRTCKTCRFNGGENCTVGSHYAEQGIRVNACYEGELWKEIE